MLNGQMEGVILKFRVKEGWWLPPSRVSSVKRGSGEEGGSGQNAFSSCVGHWLATEPLHLAFERRSAGEPCITLVELGSVALAMLTVWVDSRCRRVAMERDTHHVEEWCGGG